MATYRSAELEATALSDTKRSAERSFVLQAAPNEISFTTKAEGLLDGLHVWIDWNNDGIWDMDIVDDFQSARTNIGRDNQLDRASGGQASMTLRDLTAKYVAENPASDLYPYLMPGKSIRIAYELDGVEWPIFTGILDECIPDLKAYQAFMALVDDSAFLANADVNIDVQFDKASGVIFGLILDSAAWPGARRIIDTGVDVWPIIFTDQKQKALDLLRRLEQSEFGFMYLGAEGHLHWEDRHHRLTETRCTTPQWVCDETKYAKITPLNPLQSVKNIVILESQPKTKAGAASWVWTLSEKASSADSPLVSPGETKTYWARFADANGRANIAGDVATPAWNATAELSAFEANSAVDGSGSDLHTSVSVVALVAGTNLWASGCKLEVSNTGAQPFYLTSLRVSGKIYIDEGALQIIAQDDVSMIDAGRREYKVNVPFYQRSTVLQDIADHIVKVAAYPNPCYEVELIFQKSSEIAEQIVTRQISDCVTIQCADFTLDDNFYIERIRHEIGLAEWRCWWTVSRADAMTGSYWILGTSRLGVNTYLGY